MHLLNLAMVIVTVESTVQNSVNSMVATVLNSMPNIQTVLVFYKITNWKMAFVNTIPKGAISMTAIVLLSICCFLIVQLTSRIWLVMESAMKFIILRNAGTMEETAS